MMSPDLRRISRREWMAVVSSPLVAARPGTDYPQRAEDVSRVFEAAAGIQVTQITDSPLGNQLSYYDIPCYAPAIKALVYNTIVSVPEGKKTKKPNKGSSYPEGATWGVVSSRLDGSDSRLLATRVPATSSTVRVDMSQDGKLVTYTRCNDDAGGSWDLYGFRVGNGREVEEIRITRASTPVALTNKVKTSPATWDERAGKYLCAYAIDDKAYLVYDDGASPDGGSGPVVAPLTDPAESFHRVRLNPVFPRLLYYRRNETKHNWVIDLEQAHPESRRITDYNKSIHATWSADGRTVAGSMHGPWIEWPVADAGGRLLPAFKQRALGPFGGNGRPGIFYGCYSNDNRSIAVATRYDQEPGGSLWLMNRETGKASYLCKARYFGPAVAGQPRMGFIDGDRALVFSSDNSAGRPSSQPPQIFVVRPLPRV